MQIVLLLIIGQNFIKIPCNLLTNKLNDIITINGSGVLSATGGGTGYDAFEFKQGIANRDYYNAGLGAVKFIQESGSSKPFSIVQRSYLGYWWIRTS